jgi:predicted aspartyl protease
MALDRVESDRFPYLPLTLTVANRTVRVEALLDTGFDGDVVVPPQLITDGEPPDEHRSWSLADGSVIVAPLYYGALQVGSLDPVPADIVAIGDEPLVGRGISDRYGVNLDHGQRLIVEP